MKAYVEIIQRKERELGTDVLTHQKVWFHSHITLIYKSLLGNFCTSGAGQTTLTALSRR